MAFIDNSRKQTENNLMVKVLRPEDLKIKRKRKPSALIAAAQHSIQSILNNLAPSPTVKTRQVTKDHRTSHLSRVIVYHRPHRSFDFTSTDSRGTHMDAPEKKKRLPRPRPRLRHCSPPSSLPQKLGHLNRCQPPVPLADAELRDEAPKRENDAKTPPSSDQTIKGFP